MKSPEFSLVENVTITCVPYCFHYCSECRVLSGNSTAFLSRGILISSRQSSQKVSQLKVHIWIVCQKIAPFTLYKLLLSAIGTSYKDAWSKFFCCSSCHLRGKNVFKMFNENYTQESSSMLVWFFNNTDFFQRITI